MGLLTKPSAYTASTVTPGALNATQDTIFDWAGTTINGQGSISDINISTTASIGRSKIADTALVAGNSTSPGTQTVTRPTQFSGLGSMMFDIAPTDVGQVNASVTPTLVRRQARPEVQRHRLHH